MIEYITFTEQVNLLSLSLENTDFMSCVPFWKPMASCNNFNVIFEKQTKQKQPQLI